MNYCFCTRNKVNENNSNNKYKISSTGGVKNNAMHWGLLLLYLNMGAAPSCGRPLNHAETIDLMKLLTKNCEQTGFKSHQKMVHR